MVETLGAVLAVVVASFAAVGVLYRFVLLPNLREQLFRPIEETRRQVSENKHANRKPTLLDRIDDVEQALGVVEQTLEGIGLNQTALMRQIGEHIGESSSDRAHLWLIIEAQQSQLTERIRHDKHRDSGGA